MWGSSGDPSPCPELGDRQGDCEGAFSTERGVRPRAWRPRPTLRIIWVQKDTLSGGPCMCQGGSRETNSGQHSECRHRAEKLPVEKDRTGKKALWAERRMAEAGGWTGGLGSARALYRPMSPRALTHTKDSFAHINPASLGQQSIAMDRFCLLPQLRDLEGFR